MQSPAARAAVLPPIRCAHARAHADIEPRAARLKQQRVQTISAANQARERHCRRVCSHVASLPREGMT